jgi:hypothetical protein
MSIGLMILLVIAGILLLYWELESSSTKSRADQIFADWQRKATVDPDTRRRTIILAGHDMERVERFATNLLDRNSGIGKKCCTI